MSDAMIILAGEAVANADAYLRGRATPLYVQGQAARLAVDLLALADDSALYGVIKQVLINIGHAVESDTATETYWRLVLSTQVLLIRQLGRGGALEAAERRAAEAARLSWPEACHA
jgi:hypothetical protein